MTVVIGVADVVQSHFLMLIFNENMTMYPPEFSSRTSSRGSAKEGKICPSRVMQLYNINHWIIRSASNMKRHE